jgi:hypothetical protein
MAPRSALTPAALKRDAANRALRAALQLGAILALVSLVDAVTAWASGGRFDVRLVVGAALVAGLGPIAALLHRLVIDQLAVPSALPPADPGRPATRRPRRRRTAAGTAAVHVLAVVAIVAGAASLIR